MLSIQIDNPALEADLKQTFGDNPQSVARAFAEFIQAKKVSNDINISLAQLEQGQAVNFSEVFNSIRAKYE
jgi:methionine synthase II (cobalamin-independent)